MTDFDGEPYIPTIDAILSVADLEQVSIKRIRNALQELFVVKFEDDNKKKMSDLILERYHNLMDERSSAKSKKKQMEEEDAILAAKLQSEGGSGRIKRKSNNASNKVTKPKKPRKAVSPSGNSIAALSLNLSPKLAEFLGEQRLPRTQVVKKVWEYVKEHDLQNPDDKREILCDENMQGVFGKKVTMFQLNKVLSQHLYKDDE